jgi:phenylalanyl-tRNA synthetase alpha subunit
MSIERSLSTEHQANIKTASTEEVIQVAYKNEKQAKSSKINDVLNVLDLPDEQEDIFTKKLEQLNSKTLKYLTSKSQEEILNFLTQKNQIETTQETQKQTIDTQYIDHKLTQIKQAFPQQILDKHPNIATKLNSLDTITNPTEKDQVLQDILQTLKQP